MILFVCFNKKNCQEQKKIYRLYHPTILNDGNFLFDVKDIHILGCPLFFVFVPSDIKNSHPEYRTSLLVDEGTLVNEFITHMNDASHSINSDFRAYMTENTVLILTAELAKNVQPRTVRYGKSMQKTAHVSVDDCKAMSQIELTLFDSCDHPILAKEEEEEEDEDEEIEIVNPTHECNYMQALTTTSNITQLDIDKMKENGWATSAVIDFILAFVLQSEISSGNMDGVFVPLASFAARLVDNGKDMSGRYIRHMFSSVFAKCFMPEETSLIIPQDVVLLPVNYINTHWLLYALWKPFNSATSDPVIFVFDSLKRTVPPHFHQLMRDSVVFFIEQHWRMTRPDMLRIGHRGVVHVPVNQKTNGSDCGFFVCQFIIKICRMGRQRRIDFFNTIINHYTTGFIKEEVVFPGIDNGMVNEWKIKFESAMLQLKNKK